ncbi:hypothetical protein B0H10DRAFT_2213396 [Mycena sp. CBHHK59/15]|nr:hypothetical protein B0H10DRAFT_2213396 [Mycena sp. CBHHK59/15]
MLRPIPAPKLGMFAAAQMYAATAAAPKVSIPLRVAKALPMSVAALANALFVAPKMHGWHTGTRGVSTNIQTWSAMFHDETVHSVRGLLTFKALMPLKPNCSVAAVAAAYSRLQKGLIYNFVDTGFYAHTTSTNGWVISPNTLLARWMLDTTILVNEDEVAYHCAVAGITPTMMDDCWSFRYQWLVTSQSLVNPLPGWTADELDDLLVVAGSINAPPRLYDPVLDVSAMHIGKISLATQWHEPQHPHKIVPCDEATGTTTFNRGCGTRGAGHHGSGTPAHNMSVMPSGYRQGSGFAALASAFGGDSATAAHPTLLAPSPVVGPSNLTPIMVFQPPMPMAPLAALQNEVRTPNSQLAAGTLIPHAMIGEAWSTDQFNQYVVSESTLSLETFSHVYAGLSSDSSTTSSTSPDSLSLQMALDDPMSLISGMLEATSSKDVFEQYDRWGYMD